MHVYEIFRNVVLKYPLNWNNLVIISLLVYNIFKSSVKSIRKIQFYYNNIYTHNYVKILFISKFI